MLHSKLSFLVATLLILASPAVRAQDGDALSAGNESPFFGESSFADFGVGGSNLDYSASYEMDEAGTSGRVIVTADIAAGFHTYSITQPAGGPLPTSIQVKDDNIQVTGPFTADQDVEIVTEEAFSVPVEQYGGTVNWSAPFKAKKPLDSKQTISVAVDGQVCGGGTCEPVDAKLDAKFSKLMQSPGSAKSLRAENTHAVWTASLANQAVEPGGTTTLSITAKTDEKYHVYRFVPGDEETLFRTLIVATQKSGLKFGEPTTSTKIKTTGTGPTKVEFYAEPVTWTIPITIPKSAEVGEYPISMSVAFGTCDDNSCDPPAGVIVSGNLVVAKETSAKELAFGLKETTFNAIADLPNLATWIDAPGDGSKTNAAEPEAATVPLTLWHMLAALAGGLILNFMPCVLPVIGLKVLSFVDQAGNNHRRVIALNLAFAAGIIGVMIALAVLTIFAKAVWGQAFGWGEQFTVLEFKVALAALVFAMALSFLGVWEIPIPGFAMSNKSGELMEKEGLTGAFLKGVLTTILATPCSGPMLGSLFGLSLTLSAPNVMLLYFIVGLGMALPYLALCLHPGFVDMLPKPGAWMETLKQILAFPLLLTVVFFVSSISADYRIATLLMLIFVWFACWFIGKVPAYANADRKLTAWASAGIVIALGVVVSFKFFGPIDHKLPWVAYNEPQLAQLRREGKTVMIDFTANWCVNCQINMRLAIDKPNVAALVEKNNVVPMVADWTDKSDVISTKLNELGSNSIPLLVVYPPDPNAEPIILRDILTESQVMEALKSAGPSLRQARLTSTPAH